MAALNVESVSNPLKRYKINKFFILKDKIIKDQMEPTHPYQHILKEIEVSGKTCKYYSLPDLKDERLSKLPFSIRTLLECAIRNNDGFNFTKESVEKILDWEVNAPKKIEIPFKPARVILQDLTGVPAVVDLAAMRDAIVSLG